MEKRLKKYLAEMERQSALWGKEEENGLTKQEKERRMKDLLQQISFFQHERLIHLIVTVTFALLTMLAILGAMLTPEPALFALILLLLVLLVPYVRHYYILENGVQKLYRYYDALRDAETL